MFDPDHLLNLLRLAGPPDYSACDEIRAQQMLLDNAEAIAKEVKALRELEFDVRELQRLNICPLSLRIKLKPLDALRKGQP